MLTGAAPTGARRARAREVGPADAKPHDADRQIHGLSLGVRLVVWLVGAGTLAAGAIGVSNIMLIVVKERTKEIGIRRAVGAKPSAVVPQFVVEALILTASAGYLGMVAGVALIEVVDRVLPPGGARMLVNPDVGLSDALQALGIPWPRASRPGWLRPSELCR